MSTIVDYIGKLGWAEVTTLQQLCTLRKAQLQTLEQNVYTVRIKDKETSGFLYLGWIGGQTMWVPLNSPNLAIYPSWEVAESIRPGFEGATVDPVSKSELRMLPCFTKYLNEGTINQRGDYVD